MANNGRVKKYGKTKNLGIVYRYVRGYQVPVCRLKFEGAGFLAAVKMSCKVRAGLVAGASLP